MTTPNTEFINPVKNYVLVSGGEKLGTPDSYKIGTPTATPYIPLSKGVNQVIVDWDGAGLVDIYYGPDAAWNNRRLVGRFFASQANTQKRHMFTVPADTNNYVVYCMVTQQAGDHARTIGVQVINHDAIT